MSSIRSSLFPLAAALSLLLVGCASDPLTLPADFLRLHTPDQTFKATTADDGRLWVREFEDIDEGSLGFWTDALENDLTQRGYASRTDDATFRAVRNSVDLPGSLCEFSTEIDGEPFDYLIAIFVKPRRIRTIEFLARPEVYAAQREGVLEAINTSR